MDGYGKEEDEAKDGSIAKGVTKTASVDMMKVDESPPAEAEGMARNRADGGAGRTGSKSGTDQDGGSGDKDGVNKMKMNDGQDEQEADKVGSGKKKLKDGKKGSSRKDGEGAGSVADEGGEDGGVVEVGHPVNRTGSAKKSDKSCERDNTPNSDGGKEGGACLACNGKHRRHTCGKDDAEEDMTPSPGRSDDAAEKKEKDSSKGSTTTGDEDEDEDEDEEGVKGRKGDKDKKKVEERKKNEKKKSSKKEAKSGASSRNRSSQEERPASGEEGGTKDSGTDHPPCAPSSITDETNHPGHSP